MEKTLKLVKIRGEYYLLDGHNHKVGSWCLYNDSPSKITSEGDLFEITSRVVVSKSSAEILNKERIKKGEKPLAIGDEFSVIHSFDGESMPAILATTDLELIEDGVLSINRGGLIDLTASS